MVSVLKDGQMVPPMKGNISKEKSMVEENSLGQMQAHLLEIFMIITFMVLVSMNGLMEEYLMEIGRIIRWRVMAHSHGQTVEDMLDNMLMI